MNTTHWTYFYLNSKDYKNWFRFDFKFSSHCYETREENGKKDNARIQ